MSSNKILSLDLGVTSCGFSVLNQFEDDKYTLIDYGVFMRDNPKKDDVSPKALRSEYKSKREIRKKRKKRVIAIQELLFSLNIYIGNAKEQNIDIWALRGNIAYERKLKDYEYFAILRFLAKHRGYKSLKIEDLIKEINSKNELQADCDKDATVEVPKDLENFVKTLAYLDALKCQNQDKSVPQIIYEMQKDNKVKTFRNHDNYRYMIRRKDIKREIELITDIQNEFGFFDKSIDIKKLKSDLVEIIVPQAPVVLNLDLINNCLLIPTQKCAPIYSHSYDLFKLYKTVNDLKVDGETINSEQKEIIIDYVLSKVDNQDKVEFITVKEIKKVLNIFNPDIKLNNFSEERSIKGKREDVKLLSFLWFSKMYKFDSKIISLINTHDKKLEIYDNIALTIQTKINPSDFLNSMIDIVDAYKICIDCKKEEIEKFSLTLFENKKSGTGSYSFEAIKKLLTVMKTGINEADAKEQTGLDVKNEDYSTYHKGIKYLDFYQYEKDKNALSNHVVKSIVSGALRLIKDLHSKYGTFDTIKIESAKELSIPEEAKKEIEKANKENNKIWEDLKKKYAKHAGERGLTNSDILKLKLYELQEQKGIYSNTSIGVSDVLSEKIEIEHIVPRTCGGSSAEYNLALDFKDENAKKGNKLPLDYLKGDKRTIFEEKIQKMKDNGVINYKKWKNLLAEDLDKTFKETKDDANMHATSYAEKLLGEIVKMYYPFTDKEKQKNGVGVMHISGRATTHLRKVLGVENKSRDTNFHHSEDAIIMSIMSRGYLQKLSRTFRENYGKDKHGAKKHLKSIFPTIEGAVPAEIIARLRELYEKDIDISPFFIDHEGRLKTVNFWVSKKPIGTQAHNETIQSAKDFSYRVKLESLFNDVKPKPSHKSKPEEFHKLYNSKVYERLQLVKDNQNDFTAKAIKQRGDEVVALINKYQLVTTKEEKEQADKEIRELFNAPICDVNGNMIRRVKRIGEEASIKVRKGVAYTAPSFVCMKVLKNKSKSKLILERLDIRSYKFESQLLPANQMNIFNNDLIAIFNVNKNNLEVKFEGILRSFTESGNRCKIRNPKFPLLIDKQPQFFKGNISIGSACGIIKYKTDITGKVLGIYRLGKVLIDDKVKESNHIIYESLDG
jgi:CRISPR-associated endonuclease Csn1